MSFPVDATMSDTLRLKQTPESCRPSLMPPRASHRRADENIGPIYFADYLGHSRGRFFREVVAVKKVSTRISLFRIGRNEHQSITRPVPGQYVPKKLYETGTLTLRSR